MPAVGLDALRAQIRALEGGAPVVHQRTPSGVSEVDTLLGGLPRPGIVEVYGPEGAGRTRLALSVAAAQTRARQAVAWVDVLGRLYPPAVQDLGVVLERLLVVRPVEDGSNPWIWAVEQLLRSGCFGLVVVERPGTGPMPRRPIGARWARAAEQGQSTAVVLGRVPARQLAADVRLAVGAGRITTVRDRGGHGGTSVGVPGWPEGLSPW